MAPFSDKVIKMAKNWEFIPLRLVRESKTTSAAKNSLRVGSMQLTIGGEEDDKETTSTWTQWIQDYMALIHLECIVAGHSDLLNARIPCLGIASP